MDWYGQTQGLLWFGKQKEKGQGQVGNNSEMVETIRLRNDVARLASIEQSVVMSKNGYRGLGKIYIYMAWSCLGESMN